MAKPVYSAVPPEPPCSACGKFPCACPPRPSAAPSTKPPLKQLDPVYVKIDRSGRKGKTVTMVSGLRMHPAGKEELMRRFQKLCGAGGTMKMGDIEVQGDHRARIGAALESLGYRVKIV